jgi:SAM-dependent methyltransferase
MRALPLADAAAAPMGTYSAGGFPLILCPFNAFMHMYTRRDVEQCLAEVRRLLAPGGLFALDVLNPDPAWLARDPLRRWSRTRFRHPATGERLVYTTNHVYDPATQLAWIRIYYEPDEAASPGLPSSAASPAPSRAPTAPRCVQLTHRQFYPAELEALFHYAGFTLTEHCGGFDGQPISPVSVEQVICARVR